jgi:opacity protein-like surface antigen
MNASSMARHLRGAVAVIAVAAAPALAAAQGGSIISDVGTIKVGASAGLFASSFSTGFKLNLDGVYTFSEIQPRLYFEGAGHLGFMWGSDSVSIYELIPKARVRYALSDQLSVYGDAGLGPAILHVSFPGGSDDTWTLLIRFAGGVQYAFQPNIYLTLEPLGLNVYTASGSGFAYTLLAGVLFRI